MKIMIDVPASHIASAIQSAQIRYWAREVHRSGETMTLTEDMTHTEFSLGEAEWRAGLIAMARKSPKLFGRMLDSFQIDADVGDALVQYACFGELKYG